MGKAKSKCHQSNYKIQFEYDRKSDKTLDNLIHSKEFKELVRKMVIGKSNRKNGD